MLTALLAAAKIGKANSLLKAGRESDRGRAAAELSDAQKLAGRLEKVPNKSDDVGRVMQKLQQELTATEKAARQCPK